MRSSVRLTQQEYSSVPYYQVGRSRPAGDAKPAATHTPANQGRGLTPVGPYLVTKDEIDDPQKLQIILKNNGEVMQNVNTDDMAHKIPRCIEWLRSIHTLEPGDIIATGTNHR